MNPDPSKLRHQEQQQQAAELQQTQQKEAVREFATADEIIRFDAGQTTVPPAIAARLNESIAREPKPQRSWWRRFLSGNG
jgi:outer membrane protein OmpA-like peptidoglycan-associated protein